MYFSGQKIKNCVVNLYKFKCNQVILRNNYLNVPALNTCLQKQAVSLQTILCFFWADRISHTSFLINYESVLFPEVLSRVHRPGDNASKCLQQFTDCQRACQVSGSSTARKIHFAPLLVVSALQD